jgi:pyruvate/2-oxoglutarate dehydrogenase complex dihydrolipoamide acyltransferase (E2) component
VSSSSTDLLVDVTMPQMGVSVAEGTVVGWRVEVGDRVDADQTICEISSDKIDTDVPAPVSGLVAEILVAVETTVAVGEVLARISTGEAPAPDPGEAPARVRAEHLRESEGTAVSGNGASAVAGPANGPSARRYSPVVQRIAAEHDIDLSAVTGTGRGGRVRKQDVLAVVPGAPTTEEPPLHIESPYRAEPVAPVAPVAAPAGSGAPAAGAPGAPSSPATAPGALSRMRRQIGEHMKRSLDTAAHCTTWIEVDMGRVEAARTRLGVTALAFVARAVIEALREHPALNAWLEGESYTRPADVNLGIAVSLGDDGLIVPVIAKAHELSVEGLAARIRDLARRARQRELSADDVRGGTFTITNPGQYGSIMATPIINQPQVAILDLEAVVKRPVVVTDAEGNDAIAIRPMTILGLSWDHRALDGAQAAQFLASVKRGLETV